MSKNIRDREGKNLPIDEFVLDEMCENPSIIMVAKRGSGKSWVAKAIMQNFHKIPAGIIIAPTDKMNSFYGEFFPSTYIYYEYDSEIIESMLKRQELVIEKSKEKQKQGKYLDPRGYIIMDDCLGRSKGWINDENIKELLFNGRHYKLMYILTMQFPLGIPPSLRSNFDYIFLLQTDNTSDLKRIYEHYAGMFPDFMSFKQIFDALTVNFGSMVIINRGASRKDLLDKIKWFKAPNLEHVEIEFGCKQFRKYHERNYDENWRKRSTGMSTQEFLAKKRRNKREIHISKYDRERHRQYD